MVISLSLSLCWGVEWHMGVISSEEVSWCLAYSYEHLGRCLYNREIQTTNTQNTRENSPFQFKRTASWDSFFFIAWSASDDTQKHRNTHTHKLCDLWGLKFHKSSHEIRSDVLGAWQLYTSNNPQITAHTPPVASPLLASAMPNRLVCVWMWVCVHSDVCVCKWNITAHEMEDHSSLLCSSGPVSCTRAKNNTAAIGSLTHTHSQAKFLVWSYSSQLIEK